MALKLLLILFAVCSLTARAHLDDDFAEFDDEEGEFDFDLPGERYFSDRVSVEVDDSTDMLVDSNNNAVCLIVHLIV